MADGRPRKCNRAKKSKTSITSMQCAQNDSLFIISIIFSKVTLILAPFTRGAKENKVLFGLPFRVDTGRACSRNGRRLFWLRCHRVLLIVSCPGGSRTLLIWLIWFRVGGGLKQKSTAINRAWTTSRPPPPKKNKCSFCVCLFLASRGHATCSSDLLSGDSKDRRQGPSIALPESARYLPSQSRARSFLFLRRATAG
jgi:hypothetical protein